MCIRDSRRAPCECIQMDRGFKARISGCRKYRYARRANFSMEFRRLILSARFLSNRIPQYVAITFSIYLIKLRLLNSLCEKSLLSWYQPKIRWRFGFYFEDPASILGKRPFFVSNLQRSVSKGRGNKIICLWFLKCQPSCLLFSIAN